MLPEFVRDASILEDNPFTFAEVKTLPDGIIVGGGTEAFGSRAGAQSGGKLETPALAD